MKQNSIKLDANFLLYSIFVLIAFSWTNYLFISVLIIPLSLFFVLPHITNNLMKMQLYVVILFFYCVLSTLLVSPQSLLDFSFYRRDGNIFISFIPLITLSFIKFNFNSFNFLKKLIQIVTFFNLSIYLYFLQAGNLFEISNLYYFGFTSHNAAGGFLAIISCFSLCLFYYQKNMINFLIAIFNIFTLFETGSRGSYFALILGVIFIYLHSRNYYKTIIFSIFLGLLIHISVVLWGYEQHQKYWDEDDFYAMDVMELDVRNSNNISHRIIKVWPWAVSDFLNSPITGTGFSTFNDREVPLKEILPGIKLRILDSNIYNSGHAHHSFLNFLAELGLIGFILVCLVLYQIYNSILRLPAFERTTCLLSFVVLLLMSLTEHRLVAPSQAFIFFVIYSIFLKNTYKKL